MRSDGSLTESEFKPQAPMVRVRLFFCRVVHRDGKTFSAFASLPRRLSLDGLNFCLAFVGQVLAKQGLVARGQEIG